MISVDDASVSGKRSLDSRMEQLSGVFSYEETAYHLPGTYALTGKAVHTADEAKEAYQATGRNPLVACEYLVAAEGCQQWKSSESTVYYREAG